MQSDVVEMALNIVKKSMAKSNDYIAIDSIKDSPINLEREAGSFIMRENFNMIKPKRFETVVFLFEEIIVFTTASQVNRLVKPDRFNSWSLAKHFM